VNARRNGRLNQAEKDDPMIVTIDGPAGAGKSSAARALARRLGFEFLDTGAMFRAVALAAVRAGVALDDQAGLQNLLGRLRLEMPAGRVLLDGEDVSGAIRTPEASSGASVVAASKVVRPYLAGLQQRIAAGRNMVCEGRDQGTVVFPDAGCKFFLTADPEARFQRRLAEWRQAGRTVDAEALRKAQEERDHRDANRDLAPTRPADDAILLDSTERALEQVVERMEQEVRRSMARGQPSDG
jgi:cytidylate kinase